MFSLVLARGLSVFNFAYSNRFVFFLDFCCVKTTARNEMLAVAVVFNAQVPAGGEIEFRLRGDLGVALSDFLQKCRNPTNLNEQWLKS